MKTQKITAKTYEPPRYSKFRKRSIGERLRDWAISKGLYKSKEFAEYVDAAKKIEAREAAREKSRNSHVESESATHGDNLSQSGSVSQSGHGGMLGSTHQPKRMWH